MNSLDKCRQIIDTESGRVLLYRDEVEEVLTAGDCISRQAAIDAIEPTLKSILQGNSFKAINVMDKIQELPTAQPEIIRCKDCKHWICHDRRCGYWNHGVKQLDWCCHAERR